MPAPPDRHPLSPRRRAFPLASAFAALIAALTATFSTATAVTRTLSGETTLTRIYDHILNARFADAQRETTACANAPTLACAVLDATRVWWRIQLDPYQKNLDAEFSRVVDGAIAGTEAWARREPANPEAWFYVGGAYGARVQWRVLRGERLAAARDGKRIKDTLETALELGPDLEDANFGIGLYQYYADVAPAAAKMLRWLLMLPGGDRVEGLDRMLRARERGALLKGEADFQLHVIYLWYEKDFDRALDLVEDLAARYPGNPLFPQIIAEIHDIYFHDPTASARAWDRLLMLARQRKVNEAAMAEAQAHLGLARHLETLFESDRALEHARAVIGEPNLPYSGAALAWLAAGRSLQRLGRTADSRDAFDQALTRTPSDDPFKVREQVHAARRVTVDATTAEAYRLSLAGLRAYERKAFAEAENAFVKALALRPSEAVSRYRYGLVLKARGQDARARQQWELVAGAGATTPAPVFAEACVALAAAIENGGDGPRALALYQQAARTFGAFADTRALAARNAARLQATPRR